jgi:predicted phage terminase large subunit-like protein
VAVTRRFAKFTSPSPSQSLKAPILPANLNQDRLAAASSPAGFATIATRGSANPYLPSKFHLHLAGRLVALAEGRLEYLIVQCPVQHGKTELASVWNAAWYLALHPERSVIVASYSSDFAASRIGLPVRTIMERYAAAYFGEDVKLNPASKSTSRFNLTAGGLFRAAGVDAGIAGRRADLAVIDDPFPGLKEAMSKTYREGVWNWFLYELLPRKAPNAGVVAIQSRWHRDDFIGRLIAHCIAIGARFEVVDLPAIALGPNDEGPFGEQGPAYTDALGRAPGEALWPEVRPLAFLEKQRKSVGSRVFGALFQGRPVPDGGAYFAREYFRYYELTNDGRAISMQCADGMFRAVPLFSCRVFQLIDPAASTDPDADRFALATWAITPLNDLCLLDLVYGRFDAPRQMKVIKAAYLKWPMTRAIGVESVAYQLTLVQLALATGLPVKKFRADRSKESRAQIVATRFEAGGVFFPRAAPWLAEYEEELLAFPSGEHDDLVDVTSGAGIVLALTGASDTPAGVMIS